LEQVSNAHISGLYLLQCLDCGIHHHDTTTTLPGYILPEQDKNRQQQTQQRKKKEKEVPPALQVSLQPSTQQSLASKENENLNNRDHPN
jgi:hypothetical protein